MTGRRGGKASVKAAVDAALPAPAPAFGVAGWIDRRYAMRESGLWARGTKDDDTERWLCAPFAVLAETRDENRNPGRHGAVRAAAHARLRLFPLAARDEELHPGLAHHAEHVEHRFSTREVE